MANFSVYKMFSSGTTSNSWAGIAFLTKKRLHKYIIKFVPVSERCGLLYLNTKFRSTIVVNFYAPPNWNMRKIFLDEMINILNSLSNRYNVIILGDLGKDSEYISRGVIGQAAIQQSNDVDSIKFLDYCSNKNFKVENTFFCHRDINKYTFVRGRQISQIDFFISNIHSWFVDVKASTRVNISDHKMVIAVIKIKNIWGYHNNSIPNLMVVNATSSNIIFPRKANKFLLQGNKTLFEQSLISKKGTFINTTRNGNVEVCWELFKKELAESYERLPNVNLVSRKEWMSDETLGKIYQLRMTNSSNIDLWKDIKRLLWKDRRIFIAKRAADIDKDMKENRIYDAYKKLKYFCKSSCFVKLPMIVLANGKTITDQDEQMALWLDHYMSIFDSRKATFNYYEFSYNYIPGWFLFKCFKHRKETTEQ
ncbi:uncharacterized protein LOC135926788 [Gordionus sp. m RMFG-2023]|uniref:uncharacterized protein LOC135926788 n=1 Tax=Gordionus sp. m RMFG-2023 TaxID=3053472 RepID=UPI0031FD7ECA